MRVGMAVINALPRLQLLARAGGRSVDGAAMGWGLHF
jgi:hypothetical protein